jgi:hypothetical protein
MINILDRQKTFPILMSLKEDDKPLFGKMSPQHMIEHLMYALSFSNGRSPQPLMVNERIAKTIRHHIINTEKEISIGFKAPMLGDDLLPLRNPDLATAINYLEKELDLFDHYFKMNPDSSPVSPVMGELNYSEWIIFHNKHFTHHFKQFGLL